MSQFFKRGAVVGAVAAMSMLSSPAQAGELQIIVKTNRACISAFGVSVCSEWKTYEVRYVERVVERDCIINGNPC